MKTDIFCNVIIRECFCSRNFLSHSPFVRDLLFNSLKTANSHSNTKAAPNNTGSYATHSVNSPLEVYQENKAMLELSP